MLVIISFALLIALLALLIVYSFLRGESLRFRKILSLIFAM